MFGRYRSEKISYGIVGLGRFGYALAKEMAGLEADLLILDKNEEKVREIREYTENALVIKNLDKGSLLETGIQNCDVAIVCIGEQMDISILTTLNLVSLGIPEVIASATSTEHGQILEDESIAEVNLRGKFGVNIIAIENEEEVFYDIDPDYVFKEDDVIYVIGDKENLNELTEWIDDD